MSWRQIPFEVTTPMFVHGASKDIAEFRPPALRGALRFWFRFLAGSALGHDVAAVSRAEARLFGSLGGASPLRLRLGGPVSQSLEPEPEWLSGGGAANIRYLLGQGLSHYRKGLTQAHLSPGTTGRLAVAVNGRFGGTSRPESEEDSWPLVWPLLWFLSVFGGIGARSRRGFGGIRFELGEDAASLDPGFQEEVRGVFVQALKALMGVEVRPGGDGLPLFPVWDGWRYLPARDEEFASWGEALSWGGEWLRGFRAPNPRPAGKGSETHEYRELVRPFWEGESITDAAYDVLGLGLPVGYSSRATRGESATVALAQVDGRSYRRPSMLWLRPVRAADGWQMVIQVFKCLPLPDDARIEIRGRGRSAGRSAGLSWDAARVFDRTARVFDRTDPAS